MQTLPQHTNAAALKSAALQNRLGDWTQALTGVVVDTCQALGWQAAAKGHRLDWLPEAREEYLTLDVTAFPGGARPWSLPLAVFELENSRKDARIAYSLWKVLCVRAELRVVFCYRPAPDQSARLVRTLQDEVIAALPIPDRLALEGETLLVVGGRSEAAVFPYGFFKCWRLEVNTGVFEAV